MVSDKPKQPGKSKPKGPKIEISGRTEQLWEELRMDEGAEGSAVEDVLKHEKSQKKNRWVSRALYIVLLILCVFALVNYQYISKKIEFLLFPPKTERSSVETPNNFTTRIGKSNELSIPSLGITAPVLESSSTSEEEFQKLLRDGVVRYPGTGTVGQVGNVYIFGHSSDYAWSGGDYKTVFALLPDIENGASIDLSDSSGRIYTYLVVKKFVAEKTDTELLSQDTGGKKLLTLQTSYPIGTALKRYIVQAELPD